MNQSARLKNNYLLIIWWMLLILICLTSACGKNPIPTKPIEISNTTNTPINSQTLATIKPTSSSTTIHDDDSNQYQSTNTIQNTPIPTSSLKPYPKPAADTPLQNPYPQPPLDTPVTGIISEPYPQPLVSTPISGFIQSPYPGPGLDQPDSTGQPNGDTAIPPGGNTTPNATPLIAINPIQTPAPTQGMSSDVTSVVTNTTIVRTDLKVSDPAQVKLVSGRHQLIEFFAFWCPLSKSMAPIMNGLEEKYQDRIIFTYLDIDDPGNDLFKDVLGYKNQPQVFLLDGEGRILHQWKGFTLIENFEAILTPLFP